VISLGILINGIIVSALTFSGIAIEEYFDWQVLIIMLGIIVMTYFCLYIHKKIAHPPQ